MTGHCVSRSLKPTVACQRTRKNKYVTVTEQGDKGACVGTRLEVERLNRNVVDSLRISPSLSPTSTSFSIIERIRCRARLTILVRSDYVSKRTRDFAAAVSSFNTSCIVHSTFACVYVCARARIYMRVCMYVYMYIYIYTHREGFRRRDRQRAFGRQGQSVAGDWRQLSRERRCDGKRRRRVERRLVGVAAAMPSPLVACTGRRGGVREQGIVILRLEAVALTFRLQSAPATHAVTRFLRLANYTGDRTIDTSDRLLFL